MAPGILGSLSDTPQAKGHPDSGGARYDFSRPSPWQQYEERKAPVGVPAKDEEKAVSQKTESGAKCLVNRPLQSHEGDNLRQPFIKRPSGRRTRDAVRMRSRDLITPWLRVHQRAGSRELRA
ncbi:hypothetical protein EYF80_021243 [Liparis tanakae]|uniref:Uncharacterized protein n=1 Tax=Liparis tanakae TaxID=230148 RepID=A0A4Z2HSB6_9TELE|nr:hypothetical protein EYF80_021243 [Liparis tanakae]